MSLMHEVLGRAEGALTSAFAESTRLRMRVWTLEKYIEMLEAAETPEERERVKTLKPQVLALAQ